MRSFYVYGNYAIFPFIQLPNLCSSTSFRYLRQTDLLTYSVFVTQRFKSTSYKHSQLQGVFHSCIVAVDLIILNPNELHFLIWNRETVFIKNSKQVSLYHVTQVSEKYRPILNCTFSHIDSFMKISTLPLAFTCDFHYSNFGWLCKSMNFDNEFHKFKQADTSKPYQRNICGKQQNSEWASNQLTYYHVVYVYIHFL